jgi:hypothetical protein
VFGTYGTGKSLLIGRFFKAFQGGEFFSVELSKYMTENNLVGMPNPKLMREEGKIEHNLEGTIVKADLAELDEVFDANACTLRTMLGILNERRFHRGPQHVDAPLHMAVASTKHTLDKRDKLLYRLLEVIEIRSVYLVITTPSGFKSVKTEMSETDLAEAIQKIRPRHWRMITRKYNNPTANFMDYQIVMILEQAPVGYIGGIYIPGHLALAGHANKRPIQEGDGLILKLVWA